MLNSERFVLIIKVISVFDDDFLHFLVNTVTTTNKATAIQLLVNYGFEVLQYAAGHLLTTTSNRYFHDRANISWEQTAHYALDTLSVWNRQPGMPQEPPFSEQEEEFDWLM